LNAEGQGWYSLSLHGPHSWSGSIAALDNHSTVTSTRSLGASGFRAVLPDGSDLWAGAAALSGSTLTVTPTTWPSNPCRMIVLAVEQAAEVVDPGDGPTADFQTSTEVDAETGRVAVWFDATVSNGNGEAITGYAWTFGDGSTSTEARPVKVYYFDGSYTVTLTVTTALGTDTKTTTIIVLPAPPLHAPVLVGPIDPATSGGDTENAIDEETATHTHNVRFDPLALFRPMTDDEYTEFIIAEPDPDNIQVGYWNERFLVKRTDGTIRYIYPTTLPPP
jgi:PKD repeat protein